MNVNRIIWMLFLVLTTSSVNSQNGSPVQYVENKGQWDPSILYKGDVGNASFYINKKGFSVLIHHPEDYQNILESVHEHKDSSANNLRNGNKHLRSHLYKVSFQDANDDIQLVADKMLPYYNNYFYGNDQSKWAGNCRIYLGVTAKNIYKGIDARFYSEAGQLKYDLIVAPGADVRKIQMKYDGIEKLSIRQNQLIIPTSVGESKELYPYSYQYLNNARQNVDCKFVVNGNTVSFDVRNYSGETALVIDPTIVFATLSGSRGDNWGMSATYGPDGSFFGGSIVLSPGFPVTSGAYDENYAGGVSPVPSDMAIMKFSPLGNTLLWATYIGGSGNEQPHSLIADNQGNLVIAGRTNSPVNNNGGGIPYPATGAYGNLGAADIVVTKLNASGSAIVGSMRIGGTDIDGANIEQTRQNANSLKQNYGDDARSEVILDGSGNILVASNSQSSDLNFPGSPQAALDGRQDGVVLKLNANATALIWGTFLGGKGDDASYVLSINPLNQHIYVAGGTSSTDFPGVSAGVLQPAFGGGVADGFVADLTDNGASATLNKSTYLGTSGIDQVYGIQFDEKGFPYVMGQTTGNWPVLNAVYSVANSRQFISKLKPDLSAFVYSTCFGTAGATYPNISPVAFLVDKCENVYVSGWGSTYIATVENFRMEGTRGLPTTADAFQASTDGSDFYFFILQKNAASQLFGSFFGEVGNQNSFGEHVDGGTSRFDRQGVIYQGICANCGSRPKPVWPATFGTLSTVNGAGDGCNFGALKIAMNFSGVDVGLKAVGAKQLNFCLPATVEFADTLRLAKQYIWDFGDGSKRDSTTQYTLQHTFTSAGYFNIMVIGIDSNTCNVADTAYLKIKVTTDSVKIGFNYTRRQPCTSLTFDFTNTSTISPPTPAPGPKSFVWIWNDGSPPDSSYNATHTFPGPGTYDVQLVLVDTNYCNAYEIVHAVNFTVASTIVADFSVSNLCANQDIGIVDKSVGATTYLWDFGDGTTSTDSKPSHTYASEGTYTITLTITNPNSCNLQDVKTQQITINPLPVAAFSYTPNPSQDNVPTTFINNSSPDAVRFLWSFGDGTTSDDKNPIHQYKASGTFDVWLRAYNSFGCADSISQKVEARIVTGVVVPNAFTPNNDGKNDVLYVKAFGVSKMTFRIYNRLGQKIFESSDIESGWDGKYKGVLQPTDAYAYTLNIEFFDGKKQRLKGDITLIR
ncbi:MAG: PKD domain-containing protein [Sphingobacteriales bacterium]|nr:PKD domain-containing protein [Sphingobacteriales bacterium]